MGLAKRHLSFSFRLGKGAFGEDGSDTVELTGLRASVSIAKKGGVSMSEASIRIYGMTLDVMNKLTILGKPLIGATFNQITVSAGDDDSGMSVAFVGIITEAWIDASSAPRVSFIVTAHTGLVNALRPVAPTSLNGSIDLDTVMSGIAAQMVPPIGYENSGVTTQVEFAYLPGTLREQALALARHYDFNLLMDDSTLAIWPRGGKRKGVAPVISAETGMVGYPTHTQNGIQILMLYNRGIIFGGALEVRSTFTPANGFWTPFSVAHELESETPNGRWFTQVECSILSQTVAIG
jgi:hypothetical protein